MTSICERSRLTFQLTAPTRPNSKFMAVLSQVQEHSDYWARNTTKKMSRQLGQVFSPLSMAVHLSSLLPDSSIPESTCELADPGSGTGILSIAMASKIASSTKSPQLSVNGFEIDPRLKDAWGEAWDMFERRCAKSVEAGLYDDFTLDAERLLRTGTMRGLSKPKIIQTNPPYQKLKSTSPLSKIMSENGVPVSNLYSAFVALSVCWLQDEGELFAILPRSFTSGAHFSKFRAWLGERVSIEHVVLYRSRTCFANVLQETILVRMKKTSKQNNQVRITVMDTPDSTPEYDMVFPAEQLISPSGWWLPRTMKDIQLVNRNRTRQHTLESLGISVSTGKVEMHRLAGSETIPVLYSKDFDSEGNITWGETSKPRTVQMTPRQVLDLPESGCYIGLKRISSNDGLNPQRLFPVILSRETTGLKQIGLDNHVQYLHKNGEPLTNDEANFLFNSLKSEELNAIVRTTGGTTQINQTELAKLRF
ncbi:Eco57I restriction-modification methylase domain-containing protein [Vibrio parahaemolyticus]|nr:Eco57I restriction-modification methylase domain-containing protein [Vibrio parahaemolyticus]